MWFVLVLVSFIFIMLCIGNNGTEERKKMIAKQKEAQKEIDRKRGYNLIESYIVDYIGGFKSLEPQKSVQLEICSDRVRLNTNKVQNILYKNIVDVSIKTEQEIKERVSLGKLICFGVLAFAMKGKEEVLSKSYLMITVKDREDYLGILLDSSNNANLITSINITRNDYLRNQNKEV